MPLNEETKGIINSGKLALMKPASYIINTARGGIVSQKDLVEVLKNNRLAGAGLDVFEEEPLTEDSDFSNMDNVVVSPYISSRTRESFFRTGNEVVENILNFIAGRMKNE